MTSGTFEAFLLSSDSSCLEVCPDGFFENVAGHTCDPCDSLCLTCDGNSTHCQSCQISSPFEAFLLDSSCLQSCPVGFFRNFTTHACNACEDLCETCDGTAVYCQSCKPSGAFEAFLLSSDSSCVASCPDGFFENFTEHTCDSCDPRCEICDINSTNCQVCDSLGTFESFLFDENSSCLEICPDKFF